MIVKKEKTMGILKVEWMRKILSVLTVLVSAHVLLGCAGSPVFFETEKSGPDNGKLGEDVFKVYFDREGYIYPELNSDITIESKKFRSGAGRGYLQRYFCKNEKALRKVAIQAGETYYEHSCELSENAREGFRRAIQYGISVDQNEWLDQWERIQEGLLKRQSEQLAGFLQKKANAKQPLFVFMHGYNNGKDAITKNYNAARKRLKEYYDTKEKTDNTPTKKRYVFLDIYWDGFEVSGLPIKIWAPAQYTGPLVGLRTRKLLKEVESDRPLRIITHSSGAFVVANLIGDGRKAITYWDNQNICTKGNIQYDQAYCHYKRHISKNECYKATSPYLGDYDIPKSKDLRVGMIAPATSSWSFIGETDPKPGLEYSKGILKPAGTLRLIVGQHENDYANSKALFSSCIKGTTTLGVRKSSFCEIQKHVANTKNDLYSNVDVHRVDFKIGSTDRKYIFWADHGLTTYFDRPKSIEFFDLLLSPDTVPNFHNERAENNCPKVTVRACEEEFLLNVDEFDL